MKARHLPHGNRKKGDPSCTKAQRASENCRIHGWSFFHIGRDRDSDVDRSSGSFDYETIDIDGTARKVAIAGSYHEISKSEVSATGLLGLFASLYEGCVSAADIIFVIMTCAATFGVIVKTGAFHAFIGRVVQKR